MPASHMDATLCPGCSISDSAPRNGLKKAAKGDPSVWAPAGCCGHLGTDLCVSPSLLIKTSIKEKKGVGYARQKGLPKKKWSHRVICARGCNHCWNLVSILSQTKQSAKWNHFKFPLSSFPQNQYLKKNLVKEHVGTVRLRGVFVTTGITSSW